MGYQRSTYLPPSNSCKSTGGDVSIITVTFSLSSFSCPERLCQVHAQMHEVLLLVLGEMHQVPEQKRVHHGESVLQERCQNQSGCERVNASAVFLQIAIYGKSFCPSARDAFFLLMRNIVR